MFHPIPIPEGKRRRQPFRFTAAFLGQCVALAVVILLFVVYVSGLHL